MNKTNINTEEGNFGLKSQTNNKSSFKGVFRCGKKFKAQIQAKGVQHYLGLFNTEDAAARAYDNHARMYLGPHAKTNFPIDNLETSIATAMRMQSFITLPQKSSQENDRTRSREVADVDDDNSVIRNMKFKRVYSGKKNPIHVPHQFSFAPFSASMNANNDKLPFNSDLSHSQFNTSSYNPSSSQQSNYNQSYISAAASSYNPPASTMNIPYNNSSEDAINHQLRSTLVPERHLSLNMTNNSDMIPSPFADMLESCDMPNGSSSNLPPVSSICSNGQFVSNNSLSSQGNEGTLFKQEIINSNNNGIVEEEHSEEDEEEIDWRLQIYYWVGRFTPDSSSSPRYYLWRGAWLGSFAGRPSEEEFRSSRNAFEYTTTIMSDFTAANFSTEVPLRGYYMMENDSTGQQEKYLDKDIVLHIFPHQSSSNKHMMPVVGKGDSDFGVFVLHGEWNRDANVLEMRRQYVADNDMRASMTLLEYKAYLLSSGASI